MVTPSIARSGAGLSVNQAWWGRLPFGRWVCLLANRGPTARFQMLEMQQNSIHTHMYIYVYIHTYHRYIMCITYIYILDTSVCVSGW